jgi:hypothetical protein
MRAQVWQQEEAEGSKSRAIRDLDEEAHSHMAGQMHWQAR